MPIFEYRCNNCGKMMEVVQLPGREQEKRCSCGSTNLTKLISAPFLPSSVGKPANDTCCPGCDSPATDGDPETRAACGAPGPCCCDPDS
ncbi:MAG: zinc ribbon domain-containing protein [Peptococcaceae bacterium]|nr:zinc ribbon domain-containing protein [Candidatus Syntrophopropionicum ammoniitolerans]